MEVAQPGGDYSGMFAEERTDRRNGSALVGVVSAIHQLEKSPRLAQGGGPNAAKKGGGEKGRRSRSKEQSGGGGHALDLFSSIEAPGPTGSHAGKKSPR